VKTIIVEGIIGAGKTSLSQELAEQLGPDTLYFTEPDDQNDANPYLADYYADPERFAFVMQIHLLQARFRMHHAAQWHVMSRTGDAVLDRSYFGDVAFAHLQQRLGLLSDRQFETYRDLYQCMTASVLYPNVCIFLDVPPEVSYDRIHSRLQAREGRRCEEKVSLDYLKALDEEIRVVLTALEHRGTHILRLPWAKDRATPESRAESVRHLVQEIRGIPAVREFADIYTRQT
jgi:deoxyadenosine/deoxycytidine kinase